MTNNLRSHLFLSISLFYVLVVFISNVNCANYEFWVAEDGSDITGNGTNSNPFATIQHAVTYLAKQPNLSVKFDSNIIRIKEGNYNTETVIDITAMNKSGLSITGINLPTFTNEITIIYNSDTVDSKVLLLSNVYVNNNFILQKNELVKEEKPSQSITIEKCNFIAFNVQQFNKSIKADNQPLSLELTSVTVLDNNKFSSELLLPLKSTVNMKSTTIGEHKINQNRQSFTIENVQSLNIDNSNFNNLKALIVYVAYEKHSQITFDITNSKFSNIDKLTFGVQAPSDQSLVGTDYLPYTTTYSSCTFEHITDISIYAQAVMFNQVNINNIDNQISFQCHNSITLEHSTIENVANGVSLRTNIATISNCNFNLISNTKDSTQNSIYIYGYRSNIAATISNSQFTNITSNNNDTAIRFLASSEPNSYLIFNNNTIANSRTMFDSNSYSTASMIELFNIKKLEANDNSFLQNLAQLVGTTELVTPVAFVFSFTQNLANVQYNISNNQINPLPLCKPGAVSYDNIMQCVDCAAGSYAAKRTDVSCTLCPMGTFQVLIGQASCTPCRVSTANNKTGQISCTYCSSRSTAPKTGMTDCEHCGSRQEFFSANRPCGDSCTAFVYNTPFVGDCEINPIFLGLVIGGGFFIIALAVFAILLVVRKMRAKKAEEADYLM